MEPNESNRHLLRSKLAERLEMEPDSVPAPAWMQGCPPLRRIVDVVDGRNAEWAEPELAHIARCSSCANTIRLAYKSDRRHPAIWDVFRHLYLGNIFALSGAIKLHIRKDRCDRCRMLAEHPWMIRAADLVLSGKKNAEWMRDFLRFVAPVWVPAPALRPGLESAPLESAVFEVGENQAQTTEVTVTERPDGLEVEVQPSPGSGVSGGLMVEVASPSGAPASVPWSGKPLKLLKPESDCLILVVPEIPELTR